MRRVVGERARMPACGIYLTAEILHCAIIACVKSPAKTPNFEQNALEPKRLLLHACCGPCSLEPVRVLRERGIEPVIFYSNSNIAPADEYDHRRDTIRDWCAANEVEFIEDDYVNSEWIAAAKGKQKPERCRACYAMRLAHSAEFAKANGFDALGTTLTISPYQYTEIIAEELAIACAAAGIDSFFEDYSCFYQQAQNRAKVEGLYRQNYCGCLPSKKEAEDERAQSKAQKAAKVAEREAALEEKRAEKRAYQEKQTRKNQILKELRNKC